MTASAASRAEWTLGVAGAALFMTALDQLVVGVALHSIRIDLGGSIEGLEWTVNAYTLAFAVLLITAAALGDRFGRKYPNGSTRPAGPPWNIVRAVASTAAFGRLAWALALHGRIET